MQNVRFLIRKPERLSWAPVINQIEKEGYQVLSEIQKSDVTVVLSGTYLNPLPIIGKKILVIHSDEWGMIWDLAFSKVLKEYYDEIINIKGIGLNKIMDVIRGKIEAFESGSQD